MCLKKGNKDGERFRGHEIRGPAVDTRFVQNRGD